MDISELRRQVEVACRHLLSEQNRDPYTLTYGCFDRRYWGWKLVDYPEATFQRNVYPLAWLLRYTEGTILEEPENRGPRRSEVLTEAVQAGLSFAARIQHRDGSFDQAFPQEHSFGATAFLLSPLLQAYYVVRDVCSPSFCASMETCLHRAADFLFCHDETHGHIANHLAGAALSLLESAIFLGKSRYEQRAFELLERILTHQSAEGWFLEYEGADPGYQTLCLYYLAQVYRLQPDVNLQDALKKAISFLSHFVHPDGTFGGEYGSRRTAVFYPGGLALLSREFPLAHSVIRFMLGAIAEGRTVTLQDVDMGNFAPLLSNYVTVLDADLPSCSESAPLLPWEMDDASQDFPEAGLYIRNTRRYYAVFGASNGGVLKVFDREQRALIWNDCGYVGQTGNGVYVTTQMTVRERPCRVAPTEIEIQTSFYQMLRSVPTPLQYIFLRILNLTLMRSVLLGNWLKGVLVDMLISGKRTVPLSLTRIVHFEVDQVVVRDALRIGARLGLEWLEFGRPFVAIHMASARYFEGFRSAMGDAHQVDVEELLAVGELESQVMI
jgi:hypothetical protein